MSTRRVAVYVDRRDQLSRLSLLAFVCDRWRDDGIDVVVLDDPDRRVAADVAIMHVNATYRAAAYEAVLPHYPRVLNGRVRDISKRRVSRQLVTRTSSYAGAVIVKTNNNCFDQPDANRRRRQHGPVRDLWFRAVDRVLPTARAIRGTCSYPIYDSVRDVPATIWWDPRFVVERFLPERRDDHFCLRTWTFLGDREKVSRSLSPNPVVKQANIVHREFITDVPDAIRAARRRLGFDYGKFDFVIHDGVPILLDANSTPGCSGRPTPRLDAILDELAAGLAAGPSAAVGAR